MAALSKTGSGGKKSLADFVQRGTRVARSLGIRVGPTAANDGENHRRDCDSGFRRGSDVFKALALGAKAVCLGRAARWGLGAFGPRGVERLLEILKAELREAMAESGLRTLADIDPTAVRTDFP